ncbi:MAG: hypothetical protein O7H41_21425 [Planctomycetota bacterium]|nr:hypothetical protein [Planctomycetota bacterium]
MGCAAAYVYELDTLNDLMKEAAYELHGQVDPVVEAKFLRAIRSSRGRKGGLGKPGRQSGT